MCATGRVTSNSYQQTLHVSQNFLSSGLYIAGFLNVQQTSGLQKCEMGFYFIY